MSYRKEARINPEEERVKGPRGTYRHYKKVGVESLDQLEGDGNQQTVNADSLLEAIRNASKVNPKNLHYKKTR